jgi:hypothetical protein
MIDMRERECPACGEMDYPLDHDCDDEPVWNGTCPMCGEPYQSHLDHLKHCSAGN